MKKGGTEIEKSIKEKRVETSDTSGERGKKETKTNKILCKEQYQRRETRKEEREQKGVEYERDK